MKKTIIVIMLFLIALNPVFAEDSPVLKASVAKTDPIIPSAGEYFDLWIKMENLGNREARDLQVEFVNNYPFTVENERIVEIGTLGSQKDYHVEFRVRVNENAVEGDNTLKIAYITNLGIKTEKEFRISVEDDSAAIVIGNIESSPLDLTSDTEDAKITINLQNIGEGEAKLLKAKLSLPEGIEASNSFSDTYSIASIQSDESADAIFYIDIDESVEEGSLPGILTIDYKDGDDGDYKTEKLNINFPIKATPKFEIVDIKTVPEIFGPGDTVEMFIEIENKGGKDGESVSIRGFKSVSMPIDFDEKSNLIGTIDSGKTGVATLKFTVDNDATPKDYLMDLEIRTVYGDRVFVYDKTVEFEVSQKAGGNFLLYIIIIVVLAGAFFAYRKFKKKK